MSAHTPGPWETSRVAVPAGHVQITVYSVESGKRVATAFEQEANARLIAAAPELLAELAGLVQWCEDNFFGEESGPDLTAAYEALAKAKL